MSTGTRRLAAVMFTDMVNYTALAQLDESLALKLLGRHNQMLRSLFPRFHGREVKATGDGFLVEFGSALDATNCALEILRSLREYNRAVPEDSKIRLRIGVHLGDVVHQRRDILGDAVNVASRIEPLAEAEGMCVSEQVYDQVRNKISAGLVKLPTAELKNVRPPIDVYKVVPEWTGTEPPSGALDHHRLAVLPLLNISPDPGDDYLADGLTEELIVTISKLPDVEVLSRTSVTAYKSRIKRIDEIGRELNVGTVLEGSVRKVANKVRVGVQLIDAETDTHLWAENYDRDLKDIFQIQREVAERVADSLRIRLHAKDKAQIAQPATDVTEAHLLYLKGHYLMERTTQEGYETALDLFRRAVRIDPRFVLARVAMAETYVSLGFFEMMPPRLAFARALRIAKKAIALDPALPEAVKALSDAVLFCGNPTRAAKLVRQAVQLRPNRPESHLWLAAAYARCGRVADTFEEAKRALELDPLSQPTLQTVATWFLFSRRYDMALPLYEKVVGLDPANAFAWDNLGLCRVHLGEVEEGLAEIRRAVKLSVALNPEVHSDFVFALTRAGRAEEARTALSEMVRHHQRHHVGAYSIAKGYAIVGEADQALEWLEVARRERSPHLDGTGVDEHFDALRSDSRYQEFVKRIGSPASPDGR